ncbi:MAG: prepilin peptidase [Gammaproteobacteria bacterium]|nr:prepilin peptidase [Gammaproteobacteria bacterium]
MTLSALLLTHAWLFVLAAAVLGLVVGSFLNVVIARLPVMLTRQWQAQCRELAGPQAAAAPPEAAAFNLITPRSRCPHCGHAIGALENIPVVSFLWLKGRCAACKKPIARRYPAVELLSAVLSGLVAWRFGFGAAALAALLLSWALIALTFIDIDQQLLPDVITLPFLWLGLVFNLAGGFTGLASAVIGAVAGYVSLWLVFQLFKLATGKEGMGYGDFKLFALFGAWLGWQMLPVIILLASLVGAIVGLTFILLKGRDRRLPIPFGPFLCAAGWLAMLWGPEMLGYYLRVARLAA